MGEKLANLASHELFTKIFLANIHRYTENVFGIYTDCSLFTKFSSPITFTCMVHQNFPLYGTICRLHYLHIFYIICRFTNNFGVLGILDRLHGTDSAFKKTAAYKRHRIVLSFTPANKMFPDYEESLKEKDT